MLYFPSQSGHAAEEQARPRVAVALPNPHMRRLVAVTLADGFEPYEVDAGGALLDLVTGNPPDLVVLDPELEEDADTVEETVGVIRSLGCPIILIARGYPQEGEAHADDAGIMRLGVPYRPSRLLDAVYRLTTSPADNIWLHSLLA